MKKSIPRNIFAFLADVAKSTKNYRGTERGRFNSGNRTHSRNGREYHICGKSENVFKFGQLSIVDEEVIMYANRKPPKIMQTISIEEDEVTSITCAVEKMRAIF